MDQEQSQQPPQPRKPPARWQLIVGDPRLHVPIANKGYSQNGEHNIIAAIVSRLLRCNRFFVEMGAADGVVNSNTRVLAESGWSGLYIEGDPVLFEALTRNIVGLNGVRACPTFVDCQPGTTFDDVLNLYSVPDGFGVLSLDIDGNDYWVWRSLKEHHPCIVVIEFNTNYPKGERRAIRYEPGFRYAKDDYYGATSEAMCDLARSKGYRLVASLGSNLFFLRVDLAPKLRELSVTRVPFRKMRHRSKRRMVKVKAREQWQP